MKVMYVTEKLYKIGGIERLISLKSKYFAKNNISTVIVTTENSNKQSFFEFGKGTKHIELDINYNRKVKLTSLRNLAKSIKHFLLLNNTIKKEQPDIIVTCCYGYDFFFLPLIKGKSKIIREIHSSATTLQNNKLKLSLMEKFNSLYDRVIVLSEEEKKLTSSKISNIDVISNPFNEMTDYKLVEKEKIIISAGRIDPVKGFDRLIQLWSLIESKHPDWRVEIFGDGDRAYVDYLNGIIRNLNLANISLKESTNDLISELNRSTIYAMTSRTECFPMVLLEAASTDTSIISFDCPTGPRNIIKNGKSGLLIDDGDINEFANKLSLLITNDKLREELVKNAKIDINKYSHEKIMSDWVILFNKLLITK